jgi:aldehyde:ferredoxin oxidoreductase
MTEQALGGYDGRVLRVDLTKGKTTAESIDEAFCRKHIGGAGFIAHYLLKEVEPGTDPLAPENRLVFAIGPLTGIALPGSGRHCIGSKSPLTESVAKSEVGEFWGAELRMAGFDAVVIQGKSPEPVYLWVKDGEAQIREAGDLWGRNTKDTEAAIQADLKDDRIRMALIGPAGENMVRYACVMQGLKDAAGRGGLGAVMGSKNLKAVAVRGTRKPTVTHSDGVKKLRQWLGDNMDKMKRMQELGTGAKMQDFEKMGNLPIRNFQDGVFPGVSRIDAQAIKDSIRIGMEGCYACPVRCKKVIEFMEPYPVDRAYGGPEYETLAALGSNCGIDDLFAISKANELCNAYAIDTISIGGTIAFAMECYENGLLTKQDTDGIELKFGNVDAMLKMVERIARREGIGDLLAEGTARAAEKIGKGAETFAVQVKKLELPMHEPRLSKTGALGYMINPHGADHCCNLIDHAFRNPEDPASMSVPDTVSLGLSSTAPFDDIGPRKVALLKAMQLKKIIFDSLTLCQFLPYSFEQAADVTSAVTGRHITVMEQLRAAERTMTMYRLFNVQHGFTGDDDKLPSRFFKPPRDGALADHSLDPKQLERAKRYYYALMGWGENGVPTAEKLEELDIS